MRSPRGGGGGRRAAAHCITLARAGISLIPFADIKAAAVKKAADNIKAYDKPLRVAQECAMFPGCGKGTVEKIEEFLKSVCVDGYDLSNAPLLTRRSSYPPRHPRRTYGAPAEGIAAEYAKANAAAGKDEDYKWAADLDKDACELRIRGAAQMEPPGAGAGAGGCLWTQI